MDNGILGEQGMISVDTRVLYCDVEPFDVPVGLEGLTGPASGRIPCPTICAGAQGRYLYDLDEVGAARVVYQSVITEGTAGEQRGSTQQGAL